MKKLQILPIVLFFFLIGKPVFAQMAELYSQIGHSEAITSTAFSGNEKYILTGSNDKTVKLWEVASGREIRSYFGHHSNVVGVVFDNAKNRVISGGNDGSIIIWEIGTSKEIKRFQVQNHLNSIDISPDNRLLVTGSADNSVKIWELSTGEEIQSFDGHKGWIHAVTFSPDGKYVASGSRDEKIKVWDVISGGELHTFNGHDNTVWDVSYSLDGKYIASASHDRTVFLWDVATGEQIATFTGHEHGVKSVVFSPDRKFVASGSLDNTVKIWDVATGKEIQNLIGHTNAIISLAFTSDGKYLKTGSHDRTTKLWEISTGKEITTYEGFNAIIWDLDIHPNENHVAMGGRDSTIFIWDLERGELIRNFKDQNAILNVKYSKDANKLVTTGELAKSNSRGNIRLWDLTTNSVNEFKGHDAFIFDVQFSIEGNFIATGSSDNSIKLWELTTNKEYANFIGHTASVSSLVFSNDGKFIISGSFDNTLKLWDMFTGKELRSYPGHPGYRGSIWTISISPDDNYIVSGSTDGTLKLWKMTDDAEVKTFTGHTDRVKSSSFSPDGNYLISGSEDKTIRLWDVNSGELIRTYQGHDHDVVSLHFINDGHSFISGSSDGSAILWNIHAEDYIVRFINLKDLNYTAITKDKFYRTSKNASNYIHFVDGLNIYTFENFDLIYNRPDIVAERLGKASPQLIEAYYKAYLKRLDKMGFTEDQISTEMHLPEVAFVEDDFPIQTADKTLSFEVKATDSKFMLDRLNVYVNDVPVYGTRGINLKDRNTQEAAIPVDLTLSNGPNKIQVSAHNQAGAESLKETIEINYTGAQATPALHVVTIGVSDYQDDDYDLQYAAKDATDLAALYSQAGANFSDIKTTIITDSEATQETILAVKESLMQTSVDDQVVFFVAGHGLLDDNFDYYFATHDIDFENPAERGITYTELESLLDGIPARNKLLLMDTCNSGEVDKESVEATESEQLASNVSARAVGTRGFKIKKDGDAEDSELGLQNTFELMKELFADLRRGSGANVISSASGVEFALESDEWKNGVFTYSVLNGLKNKTADEDKDGTITVSELQSYVAQEVQKLTNGRQTPTSRQENLANDFRVW